MAHQHPPAYRYLDLASLNAPFKPWLRRNQYQEGSNWKTLGTITKHESEEIIDTIRSRLNKYADRKSGLIKSQPDPQLVVLFQPGDPDNVRSSAVYRRLLLTVEETGVLFVDTEFTDQATLKKLGCRAETAPGTIDLVQLGDLRGNNVFIRTLYDCRDAHICPCEPICADPTDCAMSQWPTSL